MVRRGEGRGGRVALLCDRHNLGVLEELFGSDVIVAERRVCCDVAVQRTRSAWSLRRRKSDNAHSVLPVVRDELGLDEQRVALNLVYRGGNASGGNEGVNLRATVRQLVARRRDVVGAGER